MFCFNYFFLSSSLVLVMDSCDFILFPFFERLQNGYVELYHHRAKRGRNEARRGVAVNEHEHVATDARRCKE